MPSDRPLLTGAHVRLEPLEGRHVDALVTAAAGDPELYRWTFVPVDRDGMRRYVEDAVAARGAGSAIPFATVRQADGAVVGSTRFCYLERWDWPADHPRAAEPDAIDGCEIGYTWLASGAVRTPVNTEAKLLMLTYAFEERHALRVCFHTDVRNDRSRRAIERIGGGFEGVLRGHRMASDYGPRDSARYSIVAPEWPAKRAALQQLLDH